MDPDLLAFEACVRRWRLERALSQEELDERAYLHRNYRAGVERGEQNVGTKAVLRIALTRQNAWRWRSKGAASCRARCASAGARAIKSGERLAEVKRGADRLVD